MRLLTKILTLPTITMLLAEPPDWEDNPGAYQFVSYLVGGIVLNDGDQLGDDGDIFAAFDNAGNVRGIALQLSPPFGPYVGTPVFEMTMRSNAVGDTISFKYYDASEDAILDICQTYTFSTNEQLGNLVEGAKFFSIASFCISFSNISPIGVDINYESNTAISGFQFDVDGVEVTGASGGATADAGFMISSGPTTVLAFSLTGTTLPAGSGTLLSLEFAESNQDQTLEVSNMVISASDGSSISSSEPGSIEILSYPELFEYNQSTTQAFYFFNLVVINDIEVESNDWVGAFNGDVCVGARQWNTSQCGGGICDVPVMGDYGNVLTEGYMQAQDIPTFKIYDASENLYYTAEPSENFGWFNNGMLFAELLTAVIPGCTDASYCNYNPLATEDDGSCDGDDESCFGCMDVEACTYDSSSTIDDGSCEYNDECDVCGGENVNCSDPASECICSGCTEDEACNYNPSSTIDNGSCYYAQENYNCEGSCISDVDCAGKCGGSAEIDNCGICNNYDTQPAFPYGTCDCAGTSNGLAITNNCGDCVISGNAVDVLCIEGCDGMWLNNGSHLIDDECGICGGNNSTCTDCAGTSNGSAITNNCGDCVISGNTLDVLCIEGCDGIWKNDGLHLTDDICSVCGGNIADISLCPSCSSGEVLGCDGICESGKVDDECGVCGGNNSTCIDCASTPNGSAIINNCGDCVISGNAVDVLCIEGCDDNWKNNGSHLTDDECGICGGNNSTCTDCAGTPNGNSFTDNCNECVVEGDMSCIVGCDGIWLNNGSHLIDDECGVCDGDNSTCKDCTGVPNGDAIYDNCGEECIAADPSADCSAYCDADSSNDCVQGCDGIWGSGLIVDECEVCNGNGPEEHYDCEGDCIAEIDCEGKCGGLNIPSFLCSNSCIVCANNPSECYSLDSDCNTIDMDISPYLLPDKFGISKIFPNPFNPVTHIQYELTQFGLISIKIYDIQGRVIDQLINEYQSPGHYSLNWNAINHASGMYIVEMIMQLENNDVSRDLHKILYLK